MFLKVACNLYIPATKIKTFAYIAKKDQICATNKRFVLNGYKRLY
jgi:hypothetical protein